MPSAVDAAPTHLTCKDLKSTENGEPDDLNTYMLFVDPDNGTATKDGSKMNLKATADKLRLEAIKQEKGSYQNTFSMYQFTIDRADLSFKKKHAFILQTGYASPVRMPSETTEWVSSGQCQITKMPAGNKI